MRTRHAGVYAFLLDYFPERRWRRWEIICVCGIGEDRNRRWRRFTYAGAARGLDRRATRAERGLAVLSPDSGEDGMRTERRRI